MYDLEYKCYSIVQINNPFNLMIKLQTTLCTFSIINFSLYLYSIHRHAIALKCKIYSLEILLYLLKN